MISVKSISKNFGGVAAVDNANLEIASGSITGLIGPNGAGKSTLFNIIAGLYKPDAGQVLLDGEDITARPPHELFSKGLLRTFQLSHEFATLTVRENLMMVPDKQIGERIVNSWWQRTEMHAQEQKIKQRADEVLDFLNLSDLADSEAGNLSGGQKKLLELGRTMMVDAKIVLLDEVGAGINRTLLNEIAGAILKLNLQEGYTFCLIEHDMDLIRMLCDPVIVLAEGKVLTQGSAVEVTENEQVIEAYLGRGGVNK